MLDIRDVSHEYGKRNVLNTLSLKATTGVVALVGVNGAGKSTLLSIAGGALKPKNGRVTVDDADVYRIKSRRTALRKLSIMPQRFSFLPRFRVGEFVEYIAYMKGLSWKGARTAADQSLELVGLQSRKMSRMGSLSGGMLRRVALAQAITTKPEVLILDEPTTGLDPEQRAGVRDLIKTVSADRVVLLSSHVMEDIETVAERAVILHRGDFVFDGTLPQLKSLAPDSEAPDAAEAAFLKIIKSTPEAVQ
ncbi:ABC transporter ATP-binding protein [Actinoplanes cyaneus]|uniref:ABC transporter ATP-binding protein n=1 Tax=Actinoplanes cyaneus TaxID=52696 RepID=A0A919IWJ6_9ACTN|nr:ATP-binding cassette domain-containing protein [Actinoplanes cyaneus]MCW2144358.1 ABC-type multidrug transport system, ATPase component [Actinoplanes cyaneus]GID71098.1 ABC transporter ATP-binding protein [Actinoplanes cyaneus]